MADIKKFLDSDGLTILCRKFQEYPDNEILGTVISAIDSVKVDKEEGKGLSTNDYTTAEKEKLAGIAAGATKVDVDSELDSKSTNAIQNKAVALMKKNIEDEINKKPSKTGEGASGLWNISIGGTASVSNNAMHDSEGQQIASTYIKGLSIDGKTITYTKGDGSTGTITTQDTNTTYSAGTGLSLSGTTFSVKTGYTNSGKNYKVQADSNGNLYVNVPWSNTDTKVTQTATTSNASYPLLLAPNGQTATATTTSYFDSGVTLNPSTNTIAANISGNAGTATKLTKKLTIGSTDKTFDGSADVSLTLNDIGAYSLADKGTVISSSSDSPYDLNNCTAPGNYYVINSDVAKTILHTPFEGNGYRLICQVGYAANGVMGYGYQIAFGSDNLIKFRTYNKNTWANWTSYSKTNHTHSYLPLSGGTLTGNLTAKTITISDTEGGVTHLKFSRENANYICFPPSENGCISINAENSASSVQNASLAIFSNVLKPGSNKTVDLGTSSNKWNNVYANTFYGALNGNAASAGKVKSNLVIKLNGGSTEGTNLFTFNGSSAKTVNITASSIGAAASSHTHSYLPLGGGTMTGKITGVDTQTTWIGTTRNGAFRVETAASGTKAVSALSMKTSSGAWSIGNLAGEDNLYFTYGTDTNYNANNNTINNYSISTDGAWSGSAAKLTTARTLTIGSKGKTFDGSKNVSWTLAEIGAVAKAGDTMSGKLVANATSVATLGTSQIRNIWAGTADISEVENSLNEGDIYLQYEEV